MRESMRIQIEEARKRLEKDTSVEGADKSSESYKELAEYPENTRNMLILALKACLANPDSSAEFHDPNTNKNFQVAWFTHGEGGDGRQIMIREQTKDTKYFGWKKILSRQILGKQIRPKREKK